MSNIIELPMSSYPGYTESEVRIMMLVEKNGCRIIAPETASKLYSVFLQGYSCAEIAKRSKIWKEEEVLHARKMYNWDLMRAEYAGKLHDRVHDQLLKAKAESIEFFTNMLNITHSEQKEQMLRYMITQDEKDRPDTWIKGARDYKNIIEIMKLITNESPVVKTESKTTSKVEVAVTGNTSALTPELQSKLLEMLAKGNK